jgi:hypothetical protein
VIILAVIAKQVAECALKLLGHVGGAGAVDENEQSKYYGLAPAYISVLQYELSLMENQASLPEPVMDLDTELSVSDSTALKIMPAGLAMYFALIDCDTASYSHFSQLYYGSFTQSIKPAETAIQDYYMLSSDTALR